MEDRQQGGETHMKFGILGTGMVGQALAGRLVELEHEVLMGSRTTENEKTKLWREQAGERAHTGTYDDAAKYGEIILNCTQGNISLDVIRALNRNDLAGKLLIDVANPLDFSQGGPPTLTIVNNDSLGESLQRELPQTKVVKALNTCNCQVMIHPERVGGDHDIFLCGNDPEAKETVKSLLRDFGWRSIIDLGDITNARATEQLLPIWIRLLGMYGTADFNFKIVKN